MLDSTPAVKCLQLSNIEQNNQVFINTSRYECSHIFYLKAMPIIIEVGELRSGSIFLSEYAPFYVTTACLQGDILKNHDAIDVPQILSYMLYAKDVKHFSSPVMFRLPSQKCNNEIETAVILFLGELPVILAIQLGSV